jgi:hypothetical protein
LLRRLLSASQKKAETEEAKKLKSKGALNKLLDASAKQLLSSNVAWFLSYCVYSVSRRVNAAVMFHHMNFG